ncbi:hypothetical protein PHYPO_G00160220 [Pangasianodon hypophthalmus]|uniref:Uncharacterized protein n=1 Tax=Pangasianodon hypophthalmus TaxID=310915 RepID=A0A5N5JTU4_PANHP|nr:hypothetical protein PHYPO_G00160220 [Pangasianodon hypophthalmus]
MQKIAMVMAIVGGEEQRRIHLNKSTSRLTELCLEACTSFCTSCCSKQFPVLLSYPQSLKVLQQRAPLLYPLL